MTVVRVRPGSIAGKIRAPPSKSYTHRGLVAGYLGRGRFRLVGPLDADDTRATARGLETLGLSVHRHSSAWDLEAAPPSGRAIDCGESGTTLRFLAPLAALGPRSVTFRGRGRLPLRPMRPLVRALRSLGAEARTEAGRSLPLRVRGPVHGGTVRLDASVSSQFASALLLALPTIRPDSELVLEGEIVSAAYLEATLAVLRAQHVQVFRDRRVFRIPGGQSYRGTSFHVPGDASSAAYLWASAALTGGRVEVRGVPERWPQADLKILEILRALGAEVERHGPNVRVEGARRTAFEVDLTDAPDLYPLAGTLAACAAGTTRIAGAAQAVHKESDRRAGTARLARALGAQVAFRRGSLIVRGSERPSGFDLPGATDHRIVMSAAVGALAADRPCSVGDARAVGKSYPEFWHALRELGAEVGRR